MTPTQRLLTEITEGTVQAQCLQLLRLHGWWARNNSVGLFKRGGRKIRVGTKGESDIFAIGPAPRAFVLWVETKRPKVKGESRWKTTDEQLEFLSMMRARGAGALRVESVEELAGWLTENRRVWDPETLRGAL